MFDWQTELAISVSAPVSFTATSDSPLALAMVAHNTPTSAAVQKPTFAQAL